MDKISPERRSANMRAIRLKNTKPELIIRRLLHGGGYRYRLHVKELPGKPDIVFTKRRKVIFVHGCFWHKHPNENCDDSRLPRSNLSYWGPKITKNVTRDAEHIDVLKALGWSVLVIWECETKQTEQIKLMVKEFLGG